MTCVIGIFDRSSVSRPSMVIPPAPAPPSNGRKPTAAAPVTPGSVRTRRRISSYTARRFGWVKYGPFDGSFGCGSHKRAVSTLCGSNPRSTCCRRQKLRTSSAAPTSSTSASANSVTTSVDRTRPRPEEAPREPSLSASLTSAFEYCTAGIVPKTIAVRKVVSAVNASTWPSMAISLLRGSP